MNLMEETVMAVAAAVVAVLAAVRTATYPASLASASPSTVKASAIPCDPSL